MKLKSLAFFLCFLSLAYFHVAAQATERPLGILIQTKKRDLTQSQEFKKILKKYALGESRFYPSTSVYSFRTAPHRKHDVKALEQLCQTIQENFKDISVCEVSVPLRPGPEAFSSHLSPSSRTLAHQSDDLGPKSCDLFSLKQVMSAHPEFTSSLKRHQSPYWAQEYIGQDLLREEIIAKNVDTSPVSCIVKILDTDYQKHGESVSHLIAGPFLSSLFNTKPLDYVNLEESADYIQSFEREWANFQEGESCGRIMNNSIRWKSSDLIRQAVQGLSKTRHLARSRNRGRK